MDPKSTPSPAAPAPNSAPPAPTPQAPAKSTAPTPAPDSDYLGAATAAIKAAIDARRAPPAADPKPTPEAKEPPKLGADGRQASEPVDAKPPAVEPAADPITRRLEDIAKREAALRKEREELAAKQKADEARYAKYRDFEEALPKSKLAAAKKLGLEYDALTDEVLSSGAVAKKSAETELPAEVRAALAEVAELKKWKEEREQRDLREQEEQTTRAATSAIHEHAKAAGEKYKRVLAIDPKEVDYDPIREAYQLIAQFHAASGGLPGGDRVAAMDWALGLVESKLERLARRLTPSAPAGTVTPVATEPAVSPKENSGQKTPVRTLHNGLGDAATPTPEPDTWDRDALVASAAQLFRSR